MSVAELSNQFSGRLLLPSDAAWDAARRVHNGLVDKRPGLIARCHNVADVRDAVSFGRESGLEMSVRGGGHNVAGRAVTEGGLMIDLSLMRSVDVDPGRRRARAQGGATWNEYNRVTNVYGQATTGGVVSTTGVAGLTLGGGLGWLMGKYGMGAPLGDGLVGISSIRQPVGLFLVPVVAGAGGSGEVTCDRRPAPDHTTHVRSGHCGAFVESACSTDATRANHIGLMTWSSSRNVDGS